MINFTQGRSALYDSEHETENKRIWYYFNHVVSKLNLYLFMTFFFVPNSLMLPKKIYNLLKTNFMKKKKLGRYLK